jgi:hypothetical protein
MNKTYVVSYIKKNRPVKSNCWSTFFVHRSINFFSKKLCVNIGQGHVNVLKIEVLLTFQMPLFSPEHVLTGSILNIGSNITHVHEKEHIFRG